MREATVERRLRGCVERAGGWALKLVSPGQAGVPDRLVCLPGGRVVFVELKAPGRRPRPLQVRAMERLRSLGFDVRVIDSLEAVDAFMREVMDGGV
ncbi:MAG: VRR-NUC domain-containing protein [Alicyclobacillaceae bacterium]|nr:VRR-NUC domain-containing protein [Alicyclobacillaceae bacterium]